MKRRYSFNYTKILKGCQDGNEFKKKSLIGEGISEDWTLFFCKK